MSNIELNPNKEALLLQENKARMVEALQTVGIPATMETPLSEIAELTRWIGGLRDIRLAALRSDNVICYFTAKEWNELSSNAKSTYGKMGPVLRARMKELFISAVDVPNESGATTHKFGGYGRDFVGVKNYGGDSTGVYAVESGFADTQAIITQTAGLKDNQGTLGAPAAEAAWNYKSCADDPLQWYLPSLSELQLIAEFRDQINQFLNDVSGGAGRMGDWYWSSTEYDSSSSWNCGMNGGGCHNSGRYSSDRVRAVARAN